MPSPCADCTLGCCRHYVVTITGYDMWKIARGLNLAPEQFVVVAQQSDATNKGFFLDDSGKTYNLALDKRATQEEERPCVFWLDLPGGIGRCGIYPLRPYVCQTYPANFFGATVAQRREDALCPQDAWRDGILDRPIWRERLLRMHVEHEIYALAVARWNYHVLHTPNPGLISHLGYFAFLMRYYTRLEPVRESLAPEQWLAMCERWCELIMQGANPDISVSEAMRPWTSITDRISAIASDFFHEDQPEAAVPRNANREPRDEKFLTDARR